MSDVSGKKGKIPNEEGQMPRPSAEVIDLMAALRRSLGKSLDLGSEIDADGDIGVTQRARSGAEGLTAAEAASLYESDTVLWSEMQAELLSQAAAGKRPKGIDWGNVVEEIESVGRSLVNAVESLLLQALVHELKSLLWPDTSYVEGWRNEALIFLAQAAGQFMPSMRQRIDTEKLVYRAIRAVPKTIDGIGPMLPSRALYLHAQERVRAWIVDPEHSTISLEGLEPALKEFARDLARDK